MAMFQIYALDEQIKALPTTDTASGAIASFNTDLTENLVSVKCQIVAKQASGTPSPDNPLPITTYTEMNFGDSGKNLFNDTVGTHTIMANTDKTIIIGDVWLKANQTYVISCKQTPNAVSSFVRNILLVVGNGQTVYNSAGNDYTIKPMVFTPTASGTYSIRLWGHTLPVDTDYTEFQVELGNTPSEYHAYNGTTVNIPFGQTVANGVLDVSTGKLRVTHGYYKVSNTTNLTAFSASSTNGSFARVADIGAQVIDVNNVNVFASMAQGVKYIDRLADATVCRTFTDEQGYVILRARASDNITNVNDLKALFTDCEICYELATPIEIQLDSITLQALLNENNIWCDTGDTEVKFLLTVGKKIQ